jgi:twitching motility protein PilT
MSLVPRLLEAIVAAKGDAVVLHNGDTPYVAVAGAETEISAERLTFQAVDDVLKELLPGPSQRAFDLLGSIRYDCPPLEPYPGERFTVVALREANELWLEVRREGSSAHAPAAGAVLTGAVAVPAAATGLRDDLAVPDFEALWPDGIRGQTRDAASMAELDALDIGQPYGVELTPGMPALHDSAPPPGGASPPPAEGGAESGLDEFQLAQLDEGLSPPQQRLAPPRVEDGRAATAQAWTDLSEFELDKLDDPGSRIDERAIGLVAAEPPIDLPANVDDLPASVDAPAADNLASPPRQAVVLSMARTQIRNDARDTPVDPSPGGLVRLLRIVAARGGSALYITSDAKPSMRVDGEMRALDGEEVLRAAETEVLLRQMMPKATLEAIASGERAEWVSDLPDLGRVRCVSFRDRRGAGGIFRILTARPASVEQLGLPRQVQALALEPEGLVLVAGPRSSGKSTVIAAFVDLINRTRRNHVITIESEIFVVHERHGSMISQREVRGDPQDVLAAARSALREDPDVLVIDAYPDDAITHLALEAAGSGRLVIASLSARTTPEAVGRFIDRFPPERRRRARLAFAENLRGIIAQALLRKPGGGRLAARELLLNTLAVASLIADGRTTQLPMAIEEGRKIGMMSLNESLAGLVKSSAVDIREAYRRAGDRPGLLALLKRHGVDTTPLERQA